MVPAGPDHRGVLMPLSLTMILPSGIKDASDSVVARSRNERVQVPVVDADDLSARCNCRRDLIGIVRFYQRRHSQRLANSDQFRQLGRREYVNDQQVGIRSDSAAS